MAARKTARKKVPKKKGGKKAATRKAADARASGLARDINRAQDTAHRRRMAARLRASGAFLGLIQSVAEDWGIGA